MAWDPDRYLAYADLRTRPGLELIARIPDNEPRSIVDLGSGTGDLTAILSDRWPRAAVSGLDSSSEMIERAMANHPGIDWRLIDIEQWEPEEPVDLIFSNAALHWLEDHDTYFRKLRSCLSSAGVLAVQMPDNWSSPTHAVPALILDDPIWPAAARDALPRDRVSPVLSYRLWLQPAEVDVWRTTYFQTLTGEDPIWTWVTGSVLRPVLAQLGKSERNTFEKECKAAYREAYPKSADGTTMLPFSRLFLVARAR